MTEQTDPNATEQTPWFARRERARHGLVARTLTVSAVQRLTESYVRITLSGPDLVGFASDGPADHLKLFFPDTKTGAYFAPSNADDGEFVRADPRAITRDYTPRAARITADGGELDVEFVVHGDEGPASAWADRATIGDSLTIAGPRGSHLAPPALGPIVIVTDATGLPATARWLEHWRDAGTLQPATVLAVTPGLDPEVMLAGAYPAAEIVAVPEAEIGARLAALPHLTESFVFLAGEAGMLVPLRRHLRRELGLPSTQVLAQGYWKRGEAALDHHQPLDPSDPD